MLYMGSYVWSGNPARVLAHAGILTEMPQGSQVFNHYYGLFTYNFNE
jgi:hypothetical protein